MTRIKTIDQVIEQDKKQKQNEETKRNLKEFERLKRCYPLLNLELADDNYHLIAHTGSNSSFHTTIDDGRLEPETIAIFERDHMILSMQKQLMFLYPDLLIGVYPNKDGCFISCWVDRPRDGKSCSAEAIGNIDVCDVKLHETLKQWQTEANQAKRNKWFFCSGHVCAEPKTQFGYFYFAGNYCNKWGDEHPENRRAAARETYE